MNDQNPHNLPPLMQTRGVNLYGDELFVVEFNEVVGQITNYRHGDVVSLRVAGSTRVVSYYLNGIAVFSSPRLYEPGETVTPVVAEPQHPQRHEDDDFFDQLATAEFELPS